MHYELLLDVEKHSNNGFVVQSNKYLFVLVSVRTRHLNKITTFLMQVYQSDSFNVSVNMYPDRHAFNQISRITI